MIISLCSVPYMKSIWLQIGEFKCWIELELALPYNELTMESLHVSEVKEQADELWFHGESCATTYFRQGNSRWSCRILPVAPDSDVWARHKRSSGDWIWKHVAFYKARHVDPLAQPTAHTAAPNCCSSDNGVGSRCDTWPQIGALLGHWACDGRACKHTAEDFTTVMMGHDFQITTANCDLENKVLSHHPYN